MSLVNQNVIAGASGQQGYNISRSVRLRSSASAYLSRTPASAGNRKTWTWSAWVKRGSLSTAYNQYLFSAVPSASVRDGIIFNTSSGLSVFANDGSSAWLATTQVFRDVSAWYHIVVAVDTTQATSSNRMKIYLNGSQITSFSTATYPSQNYDWGFDNSVRHTIGDDAANAPTGTYHFDGYLTEINFVDGQALTPSDFGETDAITGVWKPKKYVGTYGTNGFYLNFSDNTSTTTLGYDYSGNGNNWTPNNISLTSGVTYDSMTDVPTLTSETAGNYCVLNPLDGGSSSDPTAGNLDQTVSGSSTASGDAGSFTLTSGKWYWEVTATLTSNDAAAVGILRGNLPGATAASANPSGVYYYAYNGNKFIDGTSTAYGSSWNTLATAFNIGVALDTDAGTVTFYRNGTSQGAITLPSNTLGWKAHASYLSGTGSVALNFNFGQRPFAYTPPTGFKALNTFNLPDSTIVDGSTAFNAVLYTGNSSTQSITGVGFQPDLLWIKGRSASGYDNVLQDVVRGSTYQLYSNTTDAEVNDVDAVTAFNTDGFALGADVTVNNSGVTFVAWNWKAGGTAVSNTDGSITSSVSANTTSGFSIVTYTGTGANATVGHGLGVAPSMIIAKSRTGVRGWPVYSSILGIGKYLELNTTIAAGSIANYWGANSPTSTVFSLPNANYNNNVSGENYVAYCFAEVPGFSKFGSYTGNGSADGPFVYCGFRPKFIIFKSSSNVSNWFIRDTSRDSYNASSKSLYPNLSDAELASAANLDILSNGFKWRNSSTGVNGSGETIIYAAFAENPFKNSLAR